MKSEKPNPKKQPYDFLRLWSVTLPMILAVGLLGYLGNLADNALDFHFPLFTLVGIFAGLTGAVIQLLREINRK